MLKIQSKHQNLSGQKSQVHQSHFFTPFFSLHLWLAQSASFSQRAPFTFKHFPASGPLTTVHPSISHRIPIHALRSKGAVRENELDKHFCTHLVFNEVFDLTDAKVLIKDENLYLVSIPSEMRYVFAWKYMLNI